MTERGRFIALAGIDRAGKTTQAARLVERLGATRPVLALRFPDYTSPSGQLLRQYIDGGTTLDARTAHLLFCANRAEAVGRIRAALDEGTTVVCDRYAWCGIAYSVAKGLPFEWCCDVERYLPRPDVTLYFDLAPEVAAARPGFGGERHDSVLLLSRVAAAYDALRAVGVAHWRVNAAAPPDTVAAEIDRILALVPFDGTRSLRALFDTD